MINREQKLFEMILPIVTPFQTALQDCDETNDMQMQINVMR
jgi:hypothetical protein